MKRKLEEMESENSGKVTELVKDCFESKKDKKIVESYSERKKEKTVKSYFEEKEEMESGKVLESARKSLIKELEKKGYLGEDKIAKYCEERYPVCEEKKKKEEVVEEVEEKRKKKRMMMRGRRGGMQLVRDSNGKHILTGKTYAQAKNEQILREEEEKKLKKEEGGSSSDDDDSEPDQPRWSDENLALHLWRGVCRDKGVNCHEYVPRTDYHNMSGAEVRLDLLWRKVYKAEAEADAAAATTATTTTATS